MSRNKSRLSSTTPPAGNIGHPTSFPIQPKDQNPFGISFVVPTEEVQLPSEGRMYSEGSPLFGKEKITIRQMTAKEEDLLSNVQYLENGSLIERLLDSIIVDPNVREKDLFEGDKNAIILSARRSAYGSEYLVEENCPECNRMGTWNYDLDKATVKEIDLSKHGAEQNPENLLITFQLPKLDLPVTIKLMNSEDLDHLKKTKEKHEKLNLPFSETASFLSRVIVSVNKVVDQNLLSKLVEVLNPLDARKIRIVHNSALPDVDTEQEIVCPHCSATQRREVPFSEGFFWPKL